MGSRNPQGGPRTRKKAQMITLTPSTSPTGHWNAGASVSLSVTEIIRAILPAPLLVSWFAKNVEEEPEVLFARVKNHEPGSLSRPSATGTSVGRTAGQLWSRSPRSRPETQKERDLKEPAQNRGAQGQKHVRGKWPFWEQAGAPLPEAAFLGYNHGGHLSGHRNPKGEPG